MCNPACPTYSIANEESESPRGRIALIRAILDGHIEPSRKAQEHLDHCLLCRKCERICPANVSYAELMDGTREYLQDSSVRINRGMISRLIYFALQSRQRWSGFLRLGLWLEHRKLLGLFSRFTSGRIAADILRMRTRILPLLEKPIPLDTHFPAIGEKLGDVALFTGCLQAWTGSDSIRAAINILTHMGYSVHVPDQQQCCGALHMHGGYRQQACDLQMTNHKIIQQLPVQAIIGLSSACVVGLTENACNTPLFSTCKVYEFCDFLTSSPGVQRLKFESMHRKVHLHMPCTHKNVLRKEYQVEHVLRLIPGLDVVPLSVESHCCGAAGIYMLEYPKVADALGRQILAQVSNSHGQEIVTTNIGCSLHLQGLSQLGNSTVRLRHPAELLSEAISND